jgi:HK97 family phage prohead protease
MTEITRRDFTAPVQLLAADARSVAGVISSNSLDRWGEVIDPAGVRWGPGVKLLWSHDPRSPIGRAERIAADGDKVTASFRLASPGVDATADKAHALLRDGIIDSFSVGGIAHKWSGNKCTDFEVVEVSLVSVPANPDAIVTSFRHAPEDHQILERIHLASRVDQAWVWSEIEHVLTNEPTRGVVGGALGGLGKVAQHDLPRTVRLCKELIARYAGKVELGMEERRHDAATMICDIHMTANNAEATQFIEDTITTLSDPKLVESWIARYSDMLLLGDPDDPADEGHALRNKNLGLYRDILVSTFRDMNDLDRQLDLAKATAWGEADREKLQALFGILDDMTTRLYFASGGNSSEEEWAKNATRRIRLYAEARPLLERLAEVFVPRVAYYLIQALENLIPIDPPGAFSLIARTVKAAEKGGYAQEPMAADLIVRIVERYLADHRDIFASQQQLGELMDCIDIFVRAGWPAAQALTFKLGEIWR